MNDESNIEDVEQDVNTDKPADSPKGNGPYESREEEVIDSYRHYMSVQPEDLAACYLSASLRENREVSVAMEMAAKDRVEDLEEVFKL